MADVGAREPGGALSRCGAMRGYAPAHVGVCKGAVARSDAEADADDDVVAADADADADDSAHAQAADERPYRTASVTKRSTVCV